MEPGRGIGTWTASGSNEVEDLKAGLKVGDEEASSLEAGRGVGTWTVGSSDKGEDLQAGLEADDEGAGSLEAGYKGAGIWVAINEEVETSRVMKARTYRLMCRRSHCSPCVSRHGNLRSSRCSSVLLPPTVAAWILHKQTAGQAEIHPLLVGSQSGCRGLQCLTATQWRGSVSQTPQTSSRYRFPVVTSAASCKGSRRRKPELRQKERTALLASTRLTSLMLQQQWRR
ncbi:hypothetical protein GOODEAATRI_022489 [Goodea atripinnis]|uniref:Uncharacterized protein n=1 Tax=Goodea atripinnis TaxID=208336 RepID=A0ABV0P710_9TELE